MSLSKIIHHSHSFTRQEIYHHIYFNNEYIGQTTYLFLQTGMAEATFGILCLAEVGDGDSDCRALLFREREREEFKAAHSPYKIDGKDDPSEGEEEQTQVTANKINTRREKTIPPRPGKAQGRRMQIPPYINATGRFKETSKHERTFTRGICNTRPNTIKRAIKHSVKITHKNGRNRTINIGLDIIKELVSSRLQLGAKTQTLKRTFEKKTHTAKTFPQNQTKSQ